MASIPQPDLTNSELLYAIKEAALALSNSILSQELSIAYISLAHISGYIALFLETQSMEQLLETEKARNLALEQMLNKIHAELITLRNKKPDARG